MKIYAIGDLHLSFSEPVDPLDWPAARTYKPMDAFGKSWSEHYRKLYENWVARVSPEDLVLFPGDISWALKLSEARHDLDFLGMLPGTIVAVPGNHDYWWQSLKQVRAALPPNMRVIQNDHFIFNDVAICGSRGWVCPSERSFSSDDLKIYHRELIRLENSLKSVPPGKFREIIAVMHFMPTNELHERSGFIDLFLKYGVKTVVYGHLHANAEKWRLSNTAWGISFHLTSADFLNFYPLLIKNINGCIIFCPKN